MTIQQRLLTNLGIMITFLVVLLGVMSWGTYRYSALQENVELANRQVRGWLSLNFQVIQYMKYSLETILSGKEIAEGDIFQKTNEIIHTYIQMEKNNKARKPYLSLSEQEEQSNQLILIREQFGLINAELEKAISSLNQGHKKTALDRIIRNITQANLDKKFIELIDLALKKEELQEQKIRTSFNELKYNFIIFFILILVLSLGTSIVLMLRINSSIQNSIQLAKNELLQGTSSLGAGNLETTIHISTQDELSIVGEAFNKMTQDLKTAWQLIGQQQKQLITSSKMSALGEMAGGIAHEINNPLATIKNISGQLQEVVDDDPLDKNLIKEMTAQIEKTTNRIAKIIQGLRAFSRDGSKDPSREVNIREVVEETLSFCYEIFKVNGIQITTQEIDKTLNFHGKSTEISQVLLNLLNNAHDAILPLKEKWIALSVIDQVNWIDIQVTDSGHGIPIKIQEKIFQPFFTTKEIGKGTGMGLSISMGIIKEHHGELILDNQCENTRFIVRLPKNKIIELAA